MVHLGKKDPGNSKAKLEYIVFCLQNKLCNYENFHLRFAIPEDYLLTGFTEKHPGRLAFGWIFYWIQSDRF